MEQNPSDVNYRQQIEGGDILPHGDTIFVGLSQRTTKDAVEELKKLFPHKQIVTIELYPHILHLDCVFTILNERYALLYQDGMTEEAFYKIKDRFTYLKVTKKEQERSTYRCGNHCRRRHACRSRSYIWNS